MYEESINHIFLYCAKTRTLWVLFFSLFGVQWVLLATIKVTLLDWDGSFVGKKRKKVWRTNHLCIFWTVWKVRNKIAFEDDTLCIKRLKEFFCLFSLVRDEIICKRWSFEFSWFHWLGGISLRVEFFCTFVFDN